MSQSSVLAKRFQQNWIDEHPQDSDLTDFNLDDSLTSLGWLQNLRVSEFAQPREACNVGSKPDSNRNIVKQELCSSPTPFTHLQCSDHFGQQVNAKVPTVGTTYCISDQKVYKHVKPPYSYASLICMAMKATRKNKITLASIYRWIIENFEYYRLSDISWQNSIRHNLSLNKCFEKVARRKDEPGKGGFWRIKPEYYNMMENVALKKRPNSRDTSPPFKRFKLEDDNVNLSSVRKISRADTLLSNCSSDIDTNEEDSDNSLALRDDLNWTNILSQDIEVDGHAIKTEDILDECENSPFIPMSPPSSETNSDDLGLDFLSQTGFSMNLPLDFQTNDPLDLSVQGTTIRPPDWWTADDNKDTNYISNSYNNNHNENSGLNTPAPLSPESEQEDIIWGESLKFGSSGNSFDLDSLFAFDNMPNSKQ